MTPERAEEWIRDLSADLSIPQPKHRVDDSPEQASVKQYAGGYEADTQTIVSVRCRDGDPDPVGQRRLLRQFARHLHEMIGATHNTANCQCDAKVIEAAKRLHLFDAE